MVRAETLARNLRKDPGSVGAFRSSGFRIEEGEFSPPLGPLGLRQDHAPAPDRGVADPGPGRDPVRPPARHRPDPGAARRGDGVPARLAPPPHAGARDSGVSPAFPVLRTPEDVIRTPVAQVAETLQIAHELDNRATQLSRGRRCPRSPATRSRRRRWPPASACWMPDPATATPAAHSPPPRGRRCHGRHGPGAGGAGPLSGRARLIPPVGPPAAHVGPQRRLRVAAVRRWGTGSGGTGRNDRSPSFPGWPGGV